MSIDRYHIIVFTKSNVCGGHDVVRLRAAGRAARSRETLFPILIWMYVFDFADIFGPLALKPEEKKNH